MYDVRPPQSLTSPATRRYEQPRGPYVSDYLSAPFRGIFRLQGSVDSASVFGNHQEEKEAHQTLESKGVAAERRGILSLTNVAAERRGTWSLPNVAA